MLSLTRRHVVFSLACAPLAQAQFSTSVKVINVLASVRDKDGKIVKDMKKEDFVLTDDGHEQTIQYFSQQSDLPLTLGLLVDTSGSERRNIGTERAASYKFFENVLRPEKDKGFIIHFDREVELLQDLTSSRERLEKALNLLEASTSPGAGQQPDPNDPNSGSGQQRGSGGTWGSGGGVGFPGGGGWPSGRGGGRRPGGQGRGFHGGGTKFYDAVFLAGDEILQKQPGRKAIVMLTDGEDNGSQESLDAAIKAATRAEMLGYAIHIADEANSLRGFGGGRNMGGERPDGKKILKQLSKASGGAYFEYKKSLDDIYAQIDEELRNQYSIGYTSNQTEGAGSFRRIELSVKQKGYSVQSRSGYYS